MTNSLVKTDTSEVTNDWQEKMNRQRMNDTILKQGRNEPYTPLENLKWGWTVGEVAEFDYLWKEGHAITDIASYFNREVDEIAIIAFDRARMDKIKPRKNGIFGC